MSPPSKTHRLNNELLPEVSGLPLRPELFLNFISLSDLVLLLLLRTATSVLLHGQGPMPLLFAPQLVSTYEVSRSCRFITAYLQLRTVSRTLHASLHPNLTPQVTRSQPTHQLTNTQLVTLATSACSAYTTYNVYGNTTTPCLTFKFPARQLRPLPSCTVHNSLLPPRALALALRPTHLHLSSLVRLQRSASSNLNSPIYCAPPTQFHHYQLPTTNYQYLATRHDQRLRAFGLRHSFFHHRLTPCIPPAPVGILRYRRLAPKEAPVTSSFLSQDLSHRRRPSQLLGRFLFLLLVARPWNALLRARKRPKSS